MNPRPPRHYSASSMTAKKKKKKSEGRERIACIETLDHNLLSIIFSSLSFTDLARCSSVCKSWNGIIYGSKFFQDLFYERQNVPVEARRPLKLRLEELALKQHCRSLIEDHHPVIHQWKGHSSRVSQCRMKSGLILTGVGDKVMRLWSVESQKCLGQYAIPNAVSLVDFDFDESKIVGLIGARICIWRRGGERSIFPPHEDTIPKGLCMRYVDPEAVIGCEDGTVRVFDMYSRKCSQIFRMHAGPVTCLSMSDDQLIFSGSSLGSITISDLSSDEQIATLRPADLTGIKTLCFNPDADLVFAGSTTGRVSCWDLRRMRNLWEVRVSPNVIYSLGHMQNDTSTLVVGGIDGLLRVLDQQTGEVLSSYVMDPVGSSSSFEGIEVRKGKRLEKDAYIDDIPKSSRPPITCLAVGMKRVVTTHGGKYVTLWKFGSQR